LLTCSSVENMQRGAMKSIARTRAMRFEWQKLVTPLTKKSVVAEWEAKDSEIKIMMKEAASVSQKVEAIDWAHWKSVISSPGVVEQMQKDYEALNFPTVDPYAGDKTEKLASLDAEIVKAQKEAIHGTSEVAEADKVIATVNKVKAGGLHWDMKQWFDFLPGYEQQLNEDYENEEFLPSEEHDKMGSVDWVAAKKEFMETGNTDLGVPDERIGDMYLSEELEQVEKGTYSIARAFASREERARIQERVEKALQ